MPAAPGGPRLLLRRLREVMVEPVSPQARLDRIIITIAVNLIAEACSVYVRHSNGMLELFAAEGLNQEAVHVTRLRADEGLVGLIARNGEPLVLSDAQYHPNFSYRAETGEEIYHGFLGVPLLRAGNTLGVLVIQNKTYRVYSEEEIEAIQTAAMVLAEFVASENFINFYSSKKSPRPIGSKSTILRPIKDFPSELDYEWTGKATVAVKNRSYSIPESRRGTGFAICQERLKSCRTLAKDIILFRNNQSYNVRSEYFNELQKYIKRLPKSFDGASSMLLSDAAAINIKYLILEDKNDIPIPFAANLRTFLDHHAGLRNCYPELSALHKIIKKYHQQKPLPMDAVSQIMDVIDKNTPALFDPSVKKYIKQFIDQLPAPSARYNDLSTHDSIALPDKREATIKQDRIQEIHISGNLNKFWSVFLKGENIQKSFSAWHNVYNELATPMAVIIGWIKEYFKRNL